MQYLLILIGSLAFGAAMFYAGYLLGLLRGYPHPMRTHEPVPSGVQILKKAFAKGGKIKPKVQDDRKALEAERARG